MKDTNLQQSKEKPFDVQEENLKAALAVAAAGMPVLPVRVLRKEDGSKKAKPLVSWKNGGQGQKATTDEKQIRKWWRKWPEAVPGATTGDVFVVDLDVDPSKGPLGEQAYKALGLDPQAAALTVRTPSGGRHLYFSGEGAEGLTISGSKIAPNVDTRGEGGFVFAPGAASLFGKYQIESGSLLHVQFGLLDPLPQPIREALTNTRVAVTDQLAPGCAAIDDMADALGYISSDGGRDPWLRMLMALHHGSGGSDAGRALAHGWSATDPRYTWEEVEIIWRSFGKRAGDLVTVETLFAEARSKGWKAISDDVLDDLPEEDEVGSSHDPELLALIGEAPGGVPVAEGLSFMRPRDCAAATRPYVIKGFLGQRDVACVIGAPGVGKSVFAPDLAYAVSQGREFHGRRVKQGKVFYVAAEDTHGMQARLSALRDRYGDADGLYLVDGVSDLLNTDKGKKWSPHMVALARTIRKEKPVLVVVDTLAMAFPGLEENSAEGMGRVMSVARKLTQWGAAVLLVHHDTKDGGNGLPRGHSLLNGAIDASLHLTRSSHGVVSGRLTKNRNGSSTELELAFRIHGAEIGIDEDGDQVTAAIAEPVEPGGEATEQKLAPAQNAALGHLLDLLGDDRQSVSEEEWRDACTSDRKVSASEKLESRQRAFRRAVQELSNQGRVKFSDGSFHLYTPFEDQLEDLD